MGCIQVAINTGKIMHLTYPHIYRLGCRSICLNQLGTLLHYYQLMFYQSITSITKFWKCNKQSTNLDERLYFGSLVDFVFAHPLVHFTGIPVDAGDESVSVRLVWGAFVVVFDHDRLAARVPATEDQHHFSWFHNLTHFGWIWKQQKLTFKTCVSVYYYMIQAANPYQLSSVYQLTLITN